MKPLDLSREPKKLLNLKVTAIPIVVGALWMALQMSEKDAGGRGIQMKNRRHSNNSIDKIS